MSNQYKVGERIRMYREQLEMSVADLSAKSGVSEEIINAIEASEVIPALGVLTKVSRALGQRLGTFMDDQFKPLSITLLASMSAARVMMGSGLNWSSMKVPSL